MKSLKILKQFHAYIKPTLPFFLIAIFFEIAVVGLGLINPMLSRVLFDYAYQFKNLTLLNTTILAIIIVYFVYFFLNVLADYLQTYVSQEATSKLMMDTFYSIQCLPLKFHKEKSSGDLLYRITNDVGNTISTVMNVLPTIIIDGGRFFIILYIALIINPTLTLLALLAIPLYILETKFYAKRLQDVESEIIATDSDLFSRVQERLAGIKTIKSFGQEQAETLSFGNLIRRRYRIQVKEKTISILRTFTNSITLQMWSVVIMWYLGYQVVLGKLTIGEIVALMLYLEQLGEPIEAFSNLATSWKTNLVSMRRVGEVLDHPSEKIVEKEKDLLVKEGEIKTDRLSFAYAEEQEVLQNINVDFKPRSLTAIVGSSGSGKTTLANLLLRFFDATTGKIFIDSQNISEVKISSLRNRVGMIAQEYALFDGTILENILYGNPTKSSDDAIKAAQLAAAYDFVMKFPKKFDSPVGPSGTLLSAGERQRIAIARTLLKNPDIIIFDEATSALDPESEFHIQEIVERLKAHKTVIVIAHRLSTIKMADEIMVMEDGNFVEHGRFEELMEARGAFYRFYWKQFGGLAAFRGQLLLEMERAKRYRSDFCLAALKYLPYEYLCDTKGLEKANAFVDELDHLVKKSIRMGDNSSVFKDDLILILLPEISKEQLHAFFERILTILTAAELPGPAIRKEDILLVGAHIKKSAMRTPEELIGMLTKNLSATTKMSDGFVILEDKNEQ